MSKLTDRLRSAGYHNEHNLSGADGAVVHYLGRDHRSVLPSMWMLSVVGKKFDGPWYYHGSLPLGSAMSPPPAEEACALAEEALGRKVEWVKSPFNNRGHYPSFVEKRCLDAAMEKVRAMEEGRWEC